MCLANWESYPKERIVCNSNNGIIANDSNAIVKSLMQNNVSQQYQAFFY